VTLPIVLTLVGFVLAVAEVLLVSMGVFGIASAACVVVADVLAYQESATLLWILIGVQVVGIPLAVKGAFVVLPKMPFGRGMLLEAPEGGPRAGVEPAEHLLGRRGTALSDLRPSGTAQIDDERRTVVAEAGSVAKGTPIEVVAVEGYRIVVRPAETPSAGSRRVEEPVR
jgi:membrane-bound serine protease (ClpP class)